jgi:hypothetical protein
MVAVAVVGLSLSLAGCGSSGSSKSYEQGWDSAVRSAGVTDGNTVPPGTTSGPDWTKGCILRHEAATLHSSSRPAAAPPTTLPGDP